MEMEECQKIDLEFEADGLINDKQFSENSVGFDTHELAGGLNTENEVYNSLDINETDHLPKLHESMEPKQKQKNGRYNLRKSLAWDNAFFTSAGVLDAEELSTMITGADKSEKHLLPGIQEEVTGSTESLSTLGSDTLTMETLEDDLFVDIRASIQRSSEKASNLRSSNSNATAMGVDSTAISSLKKEDLVSQNKIPKPGLKKTSSLQTVRMSKCQPKQNNVKLGSGKAIKQDSVHSQVKQTSVAKIGVTNSILPKPPKAISSSIPSSTAAGKRDSVGTGRAKSGISNPATVSGKGTRPPKVSSLGGARRELPKPASSSNGSLLASSTTSNVHSTRSSTSSDSSSNMSSRINPGKSNLTMPRRNTVKSGNVGTGPSGPIPKTPSRATLKNKLPSSSNISSSVSPASSISEWSSASSSSSLMVNQKSSNSITSLDTSSCRSMENDTIHLDPKNHSADRTANGNENQGVVLTSNNPKKSSMQTGGNPHAPAKPSGLRMPSHKFGFFDGVKSSAPSPSNRHPPSPSAVHKQASPKNGPATGIPVRSSNSKPKNAKLPTARMVTSPASIKPSSTKPTSPASSFQEQKSTDIANFPSLSVGVKGSSSEETCQEAEKVVEGSNALLGGDVAVDKNHLKKDFDLICEATEKENGHDKNLGEGLTGDEKSTCRNVNGSTDELLSDTSRCLPIVSEAEVCRAPLALKNSFVVSNECSDMPKEVVDKTGLLLPASEQKENS